MTSKSALYAALLARDPVQSTAHKGDKPGHEFHGNQYTDGPSPTAGHLPADRAKTKKGFATVLKFNSNHDEKGRFTSNEGLTPAESGALWEKIISLAAANPTFWEAGKEQHVPLRDLIPTQNSISPANLRVIADTPAFQAEPVQVLRHEGKLYLLDGHHRSTVAHDKGHDTVLANVIDFDAMAKKSDSKSALQVLKFNENHDARGRFASAGEDHDDVPAAGKDFHVFRLAGPDHKTLENTNAGNAKGVAAHLAQVQDIEKAQSPGGSGNTIHLFRVNVGQYGAYEPYNAGAGSPATRDTVGVRNKMGAISYSFPENGQYTHGHVDSVPLSEVMAHLKSKGYQDFDDAGWTVGAQAIREVFAARARKYVTLKFNANHDAQGRFTDADNAHFVSIGERFGNFRQREQVVNQKGDPSLALLKTGKQAVKSLTVMQHKALLDYTGPYYGTINQAARWGTPTKGYEALTQSLIRQLDSALTRPVGHDMMVYRGLQASSKTAQNMISMMDAGKLTKGTVFTEKGYLSTSVVRRTATQAFASDNNGVVLHLDTPKQLKGMFMGSISAHETEAEVLFARNTKIKVHHAEWERAIQGRQLHIYGTLSQ